MHITRELLDAEIDKLSNLSLEEIKDYIASKEKETLLHDGDVLSGEACQLLFFSGVSISRSVKRALIRDISSSVGGQLPLLTAELHCPVCGKQHPTIGISKSTIMQQYLSPSKFVDNKSPFYFTLSEVCFSRHPEGLLCKECFNKEKQCVQDEARAFLEKPIDELKEYIRESMINPTQTHPMLKPLLFWHYVIEKGEKRIISISGKHSDYPFAWEDQEYQQELQERELLKEQKREQRRKEKEEKAIQAHKEYVAKLDETELPSNLLPSSPVSEFSVIKELLNDSWKYNKTFPLLTPDMFFDESYKKICTVIKDYYDNGILDLVNSNLSTSLLIRQLLEERYGYNEMLRLLSPFQTAEQNGYSNRNDYDLHLYEVVRKYVDRELYIVSQKVRHAVHDGCTSPFWLLQYVSDKIKVLTETMDICRESFSDLPECPSSRLLTFGKYKGREVKDVMERAPRYISWLIENTRFTLTEDEKEYFKILMI